MTDANRVRMKVIAAAEVVRRQHDPSDWPNLHAGPLTYERAIAIIEWWHGNYCHGSSLDRHYPPAPRYEVEQ